jgi:hypothetical protein
MMPGVCLPMALLEADRGELFDAIGRGNKRLS